MTRDDAITELSDIRAEYSCFDSVEEPKYRALSMAIETLKGQKTGKWVIFPPCFEEICMCSNCKTKFLHAYQHRDTCPNCGASMRGDTDD